MCSSLFIICKQSSYQRFNAFMCLLSLFRRWYDGVLTNSFLVLGARFASARLEQKVWFLTRSEHQAQLECWSRHLSHVFWLTQSERRRAAQFPDWHWFPHLFVTHTGYLHELILCWLKKRTRTAYLSFSSDCLLPSAAGLHQYWFLSARMLIKMD